MSEETFRRIVRSFYKCIKDTVITDAMSIQTSKSVRRLELGEVVEILEGPVQEDSFKVLRVRGRMLKDGIEGWISIAGNRGTTFLQRGGHIFKVVKETLLTDAFALEPGAEGTALKAGEVLEMYDVPKVDDVSKSTRMRVKVKSTGAIGWVTMVEGPRNVLVKVL